ncbi:sodium-dependent proline transporter-like [Babylonia areolata]|uniref:sodium-dependent proline transporter-like n=1 Tax=Babylonia areolata TaxID=304850 RepID=UPI003FD16317
MTSTQTTNLTAGMGDQISESQPKDPNLTTCDGNMRGSESRGCLGTIWAHVFREPCHEERRRKKEYVRSSWIGRVDCTTSLIGAVVGLGNLTRFPQLAFKYGSGTFLWPFILVTILLGVPMFYLEACLGQLSGKGGVLGWDIVPLFKGVGVSIALTCGVLSVYYSSMCMYPFYYFVSSWMSPLPWRHCDNPWNTNACILIETCHGHGSVKAHFRNGTCISNGNGSTLSFSTGSGYVFSSEEYWKEKVEGDGGVGPLQSHLVGCLLVVWFLCFVALGRDVLYLGCWRCF